MCSSKENSPDIVEQSEINYDEDNSEQNTGKLNYTLYINNYYNNILMLNSIVPKCTTKFNKYKFNIYIKL